MIEMIDAVKCPHCGEVTDIGGLVGPNTNDCPKCGKPALVQDPQPATPATPTQPTQGVFMDNFQAPNLVGIIMQALEQHIEAMVDKRFNERMAGVSAPSLDDIKDAITEMIDEKISDHTSEYDHDEYDETVRTVDNADLDDIDHKIKDLLRGASVSINV